MAVELGEPTIGGIKASERAPPKIRRLARIRTGVPFGTRPSSVRGIA
jgi:hypothetical protein